MSEVTTPEDVLRFWFGEPAELSLDPLVRAAVWWRKDDAFDREIRARFEPTLDRGARGELADWETTPRGRLALVILYDQLSRNMFRGSPRAFAQDRLARTVAAKAFASGDDRVLEPIERSFLLMPFMHAEDVVAQRRSVEGFTRLRDEATDAKVRASFDSSMQYARSHHDIIERFGRFPHRNEVLGRTSTPEELELLRKPGLSS